MSRCFPFPPPGYEKKPTTDEPDLLKKEKRKEKKHKKDKKDKEKRDGKEKREKDRSDGKHKEKKDKKDKHRDKKKDKEKGKSSTSDEKRVCGQFEGYNGEELHHNDEQNKDKSSSSSDRKSYVQFENGEYHEQLHKKEESSKEKNTSDDKKSSIQFRGQNGELLAQNRIKAEDAENFKFVQDLGRRIRDEEKGTGSDQFVVEGRKNSVDKVEIQKTDGRQAIMDEASFGRNATVQNKINGTTPPPLDKKIDRRIEEKEKMQEKEGDDQRGGKRKNKDRDKERQGKDKDMEKEKKEEKAKEKSEQKKAERDKSKHIKKTDTIASLNNLSAHPPENSFQGVGSEGNFKKRKDVEANGVSLENDPRPNKMARHISNISLENGRKLDFLQNPGSSLLDKQAQGASANSFKVGSKDQRVNGMIASPPVSVSAKKPPISAFNHVACKPTPIKSPPVITNHISAQPSLVPATKPPPSIPNHVAAQHPLIPTTKPAPSVPNHIAAQPLLMPTTKPPPLIPNHIAAQPPPVSSTLPPSATAKQPVSQPKPPPAVANKFAPPPLPIPKKKPPATAEASIKPPHPDTRYLNQILRVPKLEEWCGFDDQEWLFSSKEDQDPDPSSKKTTMEELQVQVWSEARHIESADVCALPYVIPY